MAAELQEIVGDFTNLVSPPDIWVKVNEMIQDPNTSAFRMAQVIQNDPGLTASLLKLVNSAYYNLPTGVDTVSRAIAIIGTNDLYSLATAITAAKVFSRIPCRLTRPEIFWRHSIGTGILAKKLARKCSVLHAERLYVAGMLHDIGSLVLYTRFPDQASEALMIANGNEEVLYNAENDIFGFNHAQVSAELLKRWHLPEALIASIEHHHEPSLAGINCLDAAIVCIANTTANTQAASSFMEEPAQDAALADPAVWEITGQAETVVDELLTDYDNQINETVAIMLPNRMS